MGRPVHVLTLSTSFLDFIWMQDDMDNESDDYRRITLGEFQEALIKARVRNTSSNVEIKWEIDSDSNDLIREFAEENNKKNGL